MADIGDGSLSRNFTHSAKDDEVDKRLRRFEALGRAGEESRAKIDELRDNSIKGHLHNQIELTTDERMQFFLNREVEQAGGAPAPGRQTQPLTPGLYEQLKERAAQKLAEDNALREADIRQKAQELWNRTADKALVRLESGQGQSQSKQQGMGQGEG